MTLALGKAYRPVTVCAVLEIGLVGYKRVLDPAPVSEVGADNMSPGMKEALLSRQRVWVRAFPTTPARDAWGPAVTLVHDVEHATVLKNRISIVHALQRQQKGKLCTH